MNQINIDEPLYNSILSHCYFAHREWNLNDKRKRIIDFYYLEVETKRLATASIILLAQIVGCAKCQILPDTIWRHHAFEPACALDSTDRSLQLDDGG